MSSRGAVAFLALGVVVAVAACGGEATRVVTPTRAPETVTVAPTRPPETPTPGVGKEWRVEAVSVDGDTVTVELRVFAGIDVRVTLDGREPDEVAGPAPTLHFIFRDAAPTPPGRSEGLGVGDGGAQQ